MPPRKKAQLAFASALLLLFLSGLATYFATRSLIASERWVIHTHEVQAAIGNIDSAISRAGRARSGYILDGQEDFLSQFDAALLEIPPALQNLRELTKDNPDQQKLWSRLEDVTNRRLSLFRVSIRLHKGNADDAQAQADLARQGLPLSAEMTSITRDMRENEHRLLDSREKNSHRLLIMTVVTLVVAFVLALELFAVNYRLLSAELTAREQAEQTVRDSEESLRRLTGRLLQLQDAERRKFSRELHDSLGQYLAGAKMNLEMFAAQHNDAFLAEAIKSLDQAMVETRTISHLLHPPLLDEAGFSSAAKWYLEGFGQRSGINVEFTLPDNVGSLPKPVALGLFRVLQESLTNIHRHSGSLRAEVTLELLTDRVILKVRDFGKGFAQEILSSVRTNGTRSGVGLAGMKERMRDLGGQLTMQPCTPGMLILATVPVSKTAETTAAD
jgi:signal transduction histidine kinase